MYEIEGVLPEEMFPQLLWLTVVVGDARQG